MKSKATLKFLLMLCCMVLAKVGWTQPTYQLQVTNEAQPTPTTYEFDVFLLHTGGSAFELANFGCGLGFDTTIVNGGILTAQVVAATSELVAAQVPTSVNIGAASSVASDGIPRRYFNVAPKANPGAGSGTIISAVNPGCSHPGTRIARFRITNTVPFASNTTCKHIWSQSAASGRSNTVISYYNGTTATNISVSPWPGNINYNMPGSCQIQPNGLILNPAASCATPATADAGPDQIVCADGSDVLLSPTFGGGASSGTWSGGAGSFTGNTYHPVPADYSAGSVNLIYTTDDPDAGGPCVAASDTVNIAFTNPSVYYADTDGDGYGSLTEVLACTQPAGTSLNNLDCNDGNAAINPGAQEVCDGVDNDCDGLVDDADGSVSGQGTFYTDGDGDGFGAGAPVLACIQPAGTSLNNADCDDSNAAINPNAQEVCDGVDNDCDGLTDDADGSVTGQGTYYADGDGDGYGAGAPILACVQPAGTSINADDCNDAAASVHPGAQEICDGLDNDCDGLTDDADGSVTGQSTWYNDLDGDGFGAGAGSLACFQPAGHVADNTDCADNNAAINPNAQEVCDGVDNDCDGLVDDADGSVTGQGTYYADGDGDGFGAGAPVVACFQPAGHVANNTDCNDANAAINPNAQEVCDGVDNDCDGLTDDADGSVTGQGTYYADGDADGFGAGAPILACVQPAETVLNNTDCNDANAAINPNAQEVCDGVDNDCDGLTDDADNSVTGQTLFYNDLDADGFGAGTGLLACSAPAGHVADNTDCDDSNGAINPNAQEVCDGVDNDCDGLIDDADGSVTGQGTYYADGDGDGYGAGAPILACVQPAGTSSNNDDCDDSNAAINPAAQEVCDGIDNNCNGLIDNNDPGVIGQTAYYADNDGDGYGAGAVVMSCFQPAGHVANNDDCDDSNAAINPTAQEVCDGVDNDCDGLTDDADGSVTGQSLWYNDFDADGYGAGAGVLACFQPAGHVADNTDCNDNNAGINPGAQEICDGGNVDEDCDGFADNDDPSAIGQSSFYTDGDNDGYGAGAPIMACDAPAGTSAVDGDCDDSAASVHPGATEVCNGIDDDCDGTIDDNTVTQDWYADADGDGFGGAFVANSCIQPPGTVSNNDDCDDSNAAINPNAQEVCDGVDNDCDGLTDDADGSVTGQGTYYNDFDADGFGAGDPVLACSQPAGHVANNLDCADNNAAINPNAQEVCDGVDNDCDGLVDDADNSVIGQGTYYADGDGDGFGAGAPILACVQPAGTSINSDDCDDSNAAINPNAQEICDGLDNDCDGLVDDADGSVSGQNTYYADNDGDGFGAGAPVLACVQPAGTSVNNDDCDDSNAAINPNAQEVCDGVDNDCDGLVDDADGSVTGQGTYYADADGDGYGAGAPILACVQPAGTSANNLDCMDNNASVNPGATEVCDLIDNDCDGNIDEGFDADADGFTSCNGDCDDSNAAVNPNATEICPNGIDDDCDGFIDNCPTCPNPPTANAGSDQEICEGDNASLSGSFGGAATTATWSSSGTGTFLPNNTTANATYQPSAADVSNGSVELYYTTDAPLGCDSDVDTVVITITPLPDPAGPVSGPALLCNPSTGSTFVYSVASVPGATGYNWTTTNPNIIILSGNGTESITVSYNPSAIHLGIVGDICVTTTNADGCGNSVPSCLSVSVQVAAPVTPGSISGPTRACPNDTATYSISFVSRAAYYTWTAPANASIISGQGGLVVQVAYDGGFTGGTLSVVAGNGCGVSPARTRTVALNILRAPDPISGPATGLCGLQDVVYSTNAVPGATSYLWTLPAGASFDGPSDGASIVVDFSNSITTGTMTVRAVNNCGAGTARSLSLKGAPAAPGPISGQQTVCTGQTYPYEVATVAGATLYTWTAPGTIINQGNKNIQVAYGLTPASNQIITVKASNDCGISPVRILNMITIQFCPRLSDGGFSTLNAYPNPAKDLLNVDFSSDIAQDYIVSLVDATGRVIYNESNTASVGENNLKIDVKGLASGIYSLSFRMGDANEQIRVFVE